VAGASTKKEMEGTYDTQGYATNKAILLSQAMRKITSTIGKQKIALILTNQLRQKLNAMPFADPWTTSGGKAIAFHSSVRIRFSLVGKISKKDASGDKDIIGVKVKAQIVKNRLGPPLRTAEFDVFFDRGIDNYGSWLKYLRDKEIVTGKSNALVYNSEALGKEFKFQEKEWKGLLDSDPKFKDDVYMKMCNAYIMSYKTDGLTDDDIEIQESSGEE
jgi:recombination protein RecA